MNPHYYKILGVTEETPIGEIKKAYHALARKNHPDLFPREERQKQHLIMMKINEAYMSILECCSSKDDMDITNKQTEEEQKPAPDLKVNLERNEVGQLKDPAYAYYKLGFDLYTLGQATFHKRFTKDGMDDFKSIVSPKDEEVLGLALTALKHFEKSYTYFLNVTNRYPKSVWYDDARSKLEDLEKLNDVYSKICLNLSL